MSASVPTSPPSQFSAGDSVTWKISSPEYSAADGYSLRYTLHNGTNKISFASSADGSDHLVSLSSTDTAAYVAGQYTYKAHAIKTGERWAVDEGIFTILPDFTAEVTVDPRTQKQRQLDEVNEAIDGIVTGRLASYSTTSGTFTKLNLNDLMRWRDVLQQQVNREQGRGRATAIRHRFTTPR